MSPGKSRSRAFTLPERRKRFVYLALGGLWLSGVAWLVLHYFCRSDGEFGPTPHPLEPWMLKLHGAFAFLALFAGGLIWAVHVVPSWKRGYRRPSGIATTALYALLAATGYGLYYLAGEGAREATSLAHWIAGLVAIGPMLVHIYRIRHR